MTDFFTKKQGKFWCKDCKIFIEYTHMIIEQHNRSKIHKGNVARELSFQNRKAMNQKFINQNMPGAQNFKEANDNNNNFNNNNFNNNFNNFNNPDQQNNPLLNIPQRGSKNNIQDINSVPTIFNQNRKRYTIESDKGSYQQSNTFLEEVKREKLQEEIYLKQGKVRKMKNKVWGLFFDDNSKQYYYYNFLTRSSQWDRPQDYDGQEINNLNSEYMGNMGNGEVTQGGHANMNRIRQFQVRNNNMGSNVNNANINTNNDKSDNKPKEKKEPSMGIIGKWETVDSKESFFEKNKVNKKDDEDENINKYEKTGFKEFEDENNEEDMEDEDEHEYDANYNEDDNSAYNHSNEDSEENPEENKTNKSKYN